jgi:hypothetical protein
MRSIVASLVLALSLAGCSSEPKVDWEGKYTPTIKKRLDDLAKQKDCGRLLAELDTARSINAAKEGGSGDLVAYIKYSLDRADCDIPDDKDR